MSIIIVYFVAALLLCVYVQGEREKTHFKMTNI